MASLGTTSASLNLRFLGPDSLVIDYRDWWCHHFATRLESDTNWVSPRDVSLASLLECLGSGHRSPVPVFNLEPLCCSKYTLVRQEGPLLGVQAFRLRSEEEGASFLLGPNNPGNEVSQDGQEGIGTVPCQGTQGDRTAMLCALTEP